MCDLSYGQRLNIHNTIDYERVMRVFGPDSSKADLNSLSDLYLEYLIRVHSAANGMICDYGSRNMIIDLLFFRCHW